MADELLTDEERIAQLRAISGQPAASPYAFEKPVSEPPATAAAGDGSPAYVSTPSPPPMPGGLEAGFSGRLDKFRGALSTAMPDVEFRVVSGYRSVEEQAQLYERLGAQHLAAPPGGSYHNFGGAVDLGVFKDGQRLGHDEAAPYLKRAADMSGDYQITPGYYFNTPDHPHFQAGPPGGLANWKAGLNLPDERGRPPGPGILPALDQAISNASAQTGVPVDYLRNLSMGESAGGRNLGKGTYQGPFQFSAETAASVGLADRNDFGQSALGAAKLAMQNKQSLERLLGRDVTWDEVTLAHQQGTGGAQALLSNPTARAVDLVGYAAVTKNGGNASMTGQEFADHVINYYKHGGRALGAPAAPGKVFPPYAATSVTDQLDDVFKPQPPAALGIGAGGEMFPVPVSDQTASVIASAFKSDQLAGSAMSQANSQFEAVERQNKAIKDALGEPDLALDNPFDLKGRYRWAFDHGLPSIVSTEMETQRIDAARQQAYDNQMAQLAARYPDQAALLGGGRPIAEVAREGAVGVARGAMAEAEAAYAAAPPGPGRVIGSFVGQAASFMYSPMGAASLLPFGAPLKAKTVLGALMTRGVQDALVNAGLTFVPGLMEEPWWREQTDRPTDLVGRLKEAAEAGAFGFGLGVAIHGAGQAASGFASLLGRMARGDLDAGAQVARMLPPGSESSLPATVVSEALDRQAKPEPFAGGPATEMPKAAIGPDGKLDTSPPDIAKPPDTADGKPLRLAFVSPEENAQKLREHIRYAQDPTNIPKPDPPSLGLDPPPVVAREPVPAIAEPLPKPPPGKAASIDYGGKPVHFEQVRPGELETDAATFQYKGGGNFAGDADALGGAAQWDPEQAGRVIVYERESGAKVIADGHQRLGLAKRVDAATDRPLAMDAYVFREADGWTPEQVRSIAAKVNIEDGTAGTPMDVARILRDRPELWDATMPLEDPGIKQAQGLARLSPEAWGKVVSGDLEPRYGAAIGRMATDTNLHAGIVDDLVRHQPRNETQARLMIGDVLEGVNRRDGFDALNGRPEVTRELVMERAQVFQRALATLRDLLPDRSERELNLLATRSPEVSAALNRASAELQAGARTLHDAGIRFAREVAALDAAGRLYALPHEPRLPDIVADTPAAKAEQVEGLQASLAERPAAAIDRDVVAGHLEPALMAKWQEVTQRHEWFSRLLADVRAKARGGELRPELAARIEAREADLAKLSGKRRASPRATELRAEIERLRAELPGPTREVAKLEERVKALDLERRDMAERVSETYRKADAVLETLPKRPVEPAAKPEVKAPETTQQEPKPEAAAGAAASPAAAEALPPEPTGDRKAILEATDKAGKPVVVEAAPGAIAKAAEAAGMTRAEAAALERNMTERAPSEPTGAPEIRDLVPVTGPDGNTQFITREEALATPREEEIAAMLEDCKI